MNGINMKYEAIGPKAVVVGVERVHQDWSKRAVFVVARFNYDCKIDRVYERVVVGVCQMTDANGKARSGDVRWRWCGEGDEPDGANSHTICDHEPEDTNLAVAHISMELARIRAKYDYAREGVIRGGAFIYLLEEE